MNTAAQVTFSSPIKADTLIGIGRVNPLSTLNISITNPLVLTNEMTIGTFIFKGTLDIAGKNLIANEIEMNGIDTAIDLNGGKITTGSLVQGNGTMNIHGGKIEAGSLLQSHGTMDINGGILEIQGNYTINKYNDACLKMVNAADYVKVGGIFYTKSTYNHSGSLTAGVLEIKGDFTREGSYNNFNPSGTHKVVLSGTEPQIVKFNNYGNNRFNILDMNTAAQVTFSSPLKVNTLIGIERINPTSTLELSITDPLILTKETITIGTFILREGMLDIAGKNLIANKIEMYGENTLIDLHGGKIEAGSLLQSHGTIDINGGQIITGSLQQSHGTMDIHGGTLEIQAAYTITGSACLKMVNEADYVKVGGDFSTKSSFDHSGSLTAGVLEIKGNFTRNNSRYNNFCASGTHKVILDGAMSQFLDFADQNSRYNNRFNILEMNNAVEVICDTQLIANTIIGFFIFFIIALKRGYSFKQFDLKRGNDARFS
jgi:hypothetical protein